jgi:tripartite-type tricarboxylate transporter receptor subunit TctC
MFDAVFTCMSHIKGGDWRALAVTTGKRASALPDLPTMAEAGLAGYEVSPAMGLLAPRGTPKHIVDQLSKEVARIMSMPEVLELIRGFGAEPMANTPEQYADYIKSEIAKWARVVKHAGIEMRNLPELPPT